MAKDKAESEIREKKEKKDKKRKHAEVADDEVEVVAEKKTKKDKKRKDKPAPVPEDADGDVAVADAPDVKAEDDDPKKAVVKIEVPLAALVPFANPLCDGKDQKKVLKSVKKAAKSKALKRGVKECQKAIRKSPASTPNTPTDSAPNGIVVLAADISPMDVISHLPVLCEDHGIPYVYVPSRAELGAAGSTKRPTSVVMITPKAGKGVEDEAGREWEASYEELRKVAGRLGGYVKV